MNRSGVLILALAMWGAGMAVGLAQSVHTSGHYETCVREVCGRYSDANARAHCLRGCDWYKDGGR